MQSEGTKNRLPRFAQPLEIAPRFPHSHCHDDGSFTSKSKSRKELQRRIASLPPSGSFFNEKMLIVEKRLGTAYAELRGL